MARTILVHLNVEVPDEDKREANEIRSLFLEAIDVGSDTVDFVGVTWSSPYAEEILVQSQPDRRHR